MSLDLVDPTPTDIVLDPIKIGDYCLERIIGQGSYGQVRLAFHSVSKEKFAVKVIEKSKLKSQKQINRLQREIRFLKLLYHPHIIKVYDVVETQDSIYIMMEYANGGELFDYIVANKRVKEKEARSFFRQVLSAVDYCHANAVIHRDLKPENLLLDEKKSIKIIDFGFGNNFSLDGRLLDTFCGSPFYAAPEMILGKKYEGPEVDMWSLGVILFALLCGHLPFDDENIQKLYSKIASGVYVCPDFVQPSAKHLISRLITVDPKERATLKEVLCHPWVMEGYESTPPNYVPERPEIKNVEDLSKDLVRRLYAFGYKDVDIAAAFNESSDITQPNAVRSTYHLLREMLSREEIKQQRLKKIKSRGLQPYAEEISPVRRQSFPTKTDIDAIAEDTERNLHINESSKRQSTNTQSPNKPHVTALGQLAPVKQEERIDYMQIDSNNPSSAHDPRSSSNHLDSPIGASQGSISPGKRRSSTARIKEDLKVVSSWFMNISTTTLKNIQEIHQEIRKVSHELGIFVHFESDSIVNCEVDFGSLAEEDPRSVSETSEGGEQKGKSSNRIVYQIEILKVGKSERQYGLNFKRINGGVWNFKKVSNRVIALMAL